jgi:hypothetical protein
MLIWWCLFRRPLPILRYCIQRFKENQRVVEDTLSVYFPFNCFWGLTIGLVRTQRHTGNTPSPESTEWFIEGRLSRGPLIWFLAHPLPRSRQKARPATHRKTEKERQLAHGRGGEGGGRGTESFYRKEAWASTNHSILSAPPPSQELVRKKRYCRKWWFASISPLFYTVKKG